jgi:16S rRNA (adenine1518-N6/adenine1519-N6)-dimethyltransferase
VRQRLGQHFLKRHSILKRIADAACAPSCQRVIEIGAGRGALTEYLLERAAQVVAIELDERLAAHLRARFTGEPRLTIIEADVLETDLLAWKPATITGNLPYYITSPVIEKVLRLGEVIERAVFLVQKEVALRLTAQSGSRDYGYLSVQTQIFADARMLFTVSPDAFQPPPDVDSAVVLLVPRSGLNLDAVEPFLRFAGACFRQRRKTLRNNLLALYSREVLDSLPEAGMRAEQLSIDRLQELYRRLQL